jgi:hypothetical protein
MSTKNALTWKRYRTFEQDLLGALELTKGELCNELGVFSCIDFIHLVPLGGNDPFGNGQYTPMIAPVVNTPIAVDRVALSGCGKRVDTDADGQPVVFDELDLAATSLDLSDADTAAAVDATLTDLYRRLLARDPLPEELEALTALTEDGDGNPLTAREFAKLACFAVATTSEFLFY